MEVKGKKKIAGKGTKPSQEKNRFHKNSGKILKTCFPCGCFGPWRERLVGWGGMWQIPIYSWVRVRIKVVGKSRCYYIWVCMFPVKLRPLRNCQDNWWMLYFWKTCRLVMLFPHFSRTSSQQHFILTFDKLWLINTSTGEPGLQDFSLWCLYCSIRCQYCKIEKSGIVSMTSFLSNLFFFLQLEILKNKHFKFVYIWYTF